MQLKEMVPENGCSVAPPISRPDERALPGDRNDLLSGEEGQPYLALWRRLACCATGAAPASRTLGLTSCVSGEGVSTVVARLAVAAASAGQPILVVDANLKRPSLHRLFRLKPGPGLAEALRGGGRPLDFIQPSPWPDLSVLVAGQGGANLAGFHDPAALAAVVTALKRALPLVLFDLPAIDQSSFTARLAGLLDGVLLVVEAERVRAEVVQREKELLVRGGAPLLGAVLNKRRQYVPAWLSRFL